MLKVCIRPRVDDRERASGVQRVIEAQLRYLPEFGIEIVDDEAQADVFVGHAGTWTNRDDKPRVAYLHGGYWSDPEYAWPKWAAERNEEIARTLVQADLVVTPAEWVANIIRRDLWRDVTVIPNGIDEELLNAPVESAHNSFIYWNKARIDQVCKIEPVLSLAAELSNSAFVVTVPIPKELGPHRYPNVRSVGVLPYSENLEVLRHAGLYLATTREVHGVSVLEALAAGVPVVGYEWGGQREQLSNPHRNPSLLEGSVFTASWYGEGALVWPNDTKSLAAAIAAIASNPALWRHLSEAARERAKAFTWRSQMERFAASLHQLWSGWDGHRSAGSPEVSIVIPCYNLGRYLDDAIKSAVAQKDAPPFEIIVVDDASDDPETREVLQRIDAGFWSGEVRLVRHRSNQYLAETLNTGIRYARGRWIVNLDADNRLPPDALASLHRAAVRHPELDCVYGQMQVIREDGSPDQRWTPGSWPPRVYDYAGQLRHEPQVHSSAMFRREMWQRVGGYRQPMRDSDSDPSSGGKAEKSPPVRLNSDAEFWTRAAALGFRFGHAVSGVTLLYRWREGSMSKVVPDYDWTAGCPKGSTLGAPGGAVLTHEPVQVRALLDWWSGPGDPKAPLVESLWPQTFDRWEVVDPGSSPAGRSAETLPPYVKFNAEGRRELPPVKWTIRFEAEDGSSALVPDALERFVRANPAPGVYNRESFERIAGGGVLVGCSSCGGGMRRPAMRAPGASPRPRSPAPRAAAPLPAGIRGTTTDVTFLGSGVRRVRADWIDPATRERHQYTFSDFAGHTTVAVYDEDLHLFAPFKSLYRIGDLEPTPDPSPSPAPEQDLSPHPASEPDLAPTVGASASRAGS